MTYPVLEIRPAAERIADGQLVRVDTDLAHHVKGEPYRYKHGWIPVGAVVNQSRFAPGENDTLKRIAAHYAADMAKFDATHASTNGEYRHFNYSTKYKNKLDGIAKNPAHYLNGAVWEYSGDAPFNNEIRRGYVKNKERQMHLLDESFTHTTRPGLLYRDVPVSALGPLDELPGKIITDKGYMSTTWFPGATMGVAGDARLKLRLPTGTEVLYVEPSSQQPDEKEVLLRRGSRIRVLSVETVDGKPLITAEVLPRDTDLAEHVPGTPYKYKHGWIPVAVEVKKPKHVKSDAEIAAETEARKWNRSIRLSPRTSFRCGMRPRRMRKLTACHGMRMPISRLMHSQLRPACQSRLRPGSSPRLLPADRVGSEHDARGQGAADQEAGRRAGSRVHGDRRSARARAAHPQRRALVEGADRPQDQGVRHPCGARSRPGPGETARGR